MVNPVGGVGPVLENQYDPSQAGLAHYQAAINFFNEQNYLAAYQDFLGASLDRVLVSRNPEILYYLGLSAEYSGDPEIGATARQFLEAYIQLPGANPETVNSAQAQIALLDAQTAQENNDLPGMLAAYEKAVALEPSLAPQLAGTIAQIKAQISLQHAEEAQQKNDIKAMLRYYRQAAAEDPTLAPQLQETIHQLEKQERWMEIQPEVDRFMQRSQDAMYPPDGVKGDPEKAIEILEEAIQEYPEIKENMPSIYYTMAQYAWTAADVDAARKYFALFEPSISQIPVEGNEQFLAAVALFKNSNLEGNPLANFTTYGANWLGHHLPFSPETWKDNVLSAAHGVMVGHLRGPSGAKSYWESNQHTHADTGALEKLETERKKLLKQRDSTKNPQKRLKLHEALNRNARQLERTQEAARAGGKTINPTAMDKMRGDHAKYSKQGKFHVVKTNVSVNRGTPQEGGGSQGHGPGYWGLGETLQREGASYKTFGKVNEVLAEGGEGIKKYQISATGHTSFLNAEERVFKMVFGGKNAVGVGIQHMYGLQARVDALYADYGVQYAGGDLTVGGQNFSAENNNALAMGGTSAKVSAVTVQGDLHGGFDLGHKGMHVGANAGGFAGPAQATGDVSGSVLGQGGFMMAQAWVGLGGKINVDATVSSTGICLDLGIGAALGVGGYTSVLINLNLESLAQTLLAIYGDSDHSMEGMLSRVGQLAFSGVSAAGDLLERTGGGIASVSEGAMDYIAQHAPMAPIGTLVPAAAGIVVREAGRVISQVGGDFAKGDVGGGLKNLFVESGKGVVNTIVDTAKVLGKTVKNFFSGW